MPCRRKKVKSSLEMDEVGMKILKAMAEMKAPASCGEIAKRAGTPTLTLKVTGKLRPFLNKGLVERPEKGEYITSEAGLKLIK